MLAIARILRTGRALLLLDEPTEGLAPSSCSRSGTIRQLKRRVHHPARRAELPLRRHGGRPPLRDGARARGGHDRQRGLERSMDKLHDTSGYNRALAHQLDIERTTHVTHVAPRAWPRGLGRAPAQARSPTASIKIGVLNDQSSLYADLSGQGSVVAARMAVEDFGAEQEGHQGRDHLADHQNKPTSARHRPAVARRRQGRRDRGRARTPAWRWP
jgi:hypothetical protein